jgi:small subunit ribosomal protein S3Ae
VICRIPNSIGLDIEKSCKGIFPVRDCMIRKVKMLKKPKFDIIKLMEMHGDAAGEDAGKGVSREAPTVETLKGSGGRL